MVLCHQLIHKRAEITAEDKQSTIQPPKGKAWEELVESLRLVGWCPQKGYRHKGKLRQSRYITSEAGSTNNSRLPTGQLRLLTRLLNLIKLRKDGESSGRWQSAPAVEMAGPSPSCQVFRTEQALSLQKARVFS